MLVRWSVADSQAKKTFAPSLLPQPAAPHNPLRVGCVNPNHMLTFLRP